MTSVIRVKRRIDEDPAEALFLSCKRRRESDILDVRSILSFAGTIHSKDEPVSIHIKDAIRQKKIHKDHQPHSTKFKHALHLPEVTSKLRKETEQTSRANRYRITWSRRALDLELLDQIIDQNDANSVEESHDSSEKSVPPSRIECGKDVNDSCTTNTKHSDSTNKENLVISPLNHSDDSSVDLTRSNESNNDSVLTQVNKTFKHSETADKKSVVKEDKMFCIFDVENAVDDDPLMGCDQSTSGITLNNVPMQSSRVATPPSNEFVYDLYYTHNNLSDLDKEAVLTVKALCDELVCDQEIESSDRDLVYEDEDDSNDENNWRADYPDEDPRYFENAEEDYDYAEDMVDTNFLREGDDDGDLLAYWMGTRCKVDAASDDGEDEYEGDDGDSSESSDE